MHSLRGSASFRAFSEISSFKGEKEKYLTFEGDQFFMNTIKTLETTDNEICLQVELFLF